MAEGLTDFSKICSKIRRELDPHSLTVTGKSVGWAVSECLGAGTGTCDSVNLNV